MNFCENDLFQKTKYHFSHIFLSKLRRSSEIEFLKLKTVFSELKEKIFQPEAEHFSNGQLFVLNLKWAVLKSGAEKST